MVVTRAERAIARAALLVLTLALLSLVWPQPFGGHTSFAGVDGDSMLGTYDDGDLIVLRAQASYGVGDIVTFRVPEGEFGAGAHVIHRIIGGDPASGFVMQGDNRSRPDEWRPRPDDVVGAAWVRIPGGAATFQSLGTPVNLGALCASLTVAMMLLPRRREPRAV
jgi:signal peptidase